MNNKMENPVTFLNNTTAALTEMDELIPKELQMPVGIAVSKQRGCLPGRRCFHFGDLVLFFLHTHITVCTLPGIVDSRQPRY